ncbi:S-adenosyl-L-methionine-dependent methyltransferase [Gloeopeniophorella convolvens]|nr:S-adenosyl-L-methionine-dependent methyltransferase [Gloeopeniophorella convolvens]
MPSSLSKVATTVVDDDPDAYEAKHVHEVYDQIASHFSSTRYKPWPIIARFLSSIPAGWVGLDSGTGNGKYLPLPADQPGKIWTIGLDRSRNLLNAARIAGGSETIREVVWGDVLGRGWRQGGFDYAISIATIHHLATVGRRVTAVKRLLDSVSPRHGRILIYVWAIDQDELSKRAIPAAERDATRENESEEPVAVGQDVFVPWVFSSESARPKLPLGAGVAEPQSDALTGTSKTFQRYYHMFAKGELDQLVQIAAHDLGLRVGRSPESDGGGAQGIEIVESGWERSNYYIELLRWRI